MKNHSKIVTALEALALGVFFLAIILQSLFISHIFVALPRLAEVLPSVLVYLTNEERSQENLTTLTSNDTLIKAAQAKANDMAQKEYFAHTSPDGKTPWYWLDSAGYPYVKAGENLAVNFVDSEDVIQAWLNSPTHKANIMNGNYKEIGIATAEGQYKGKRAIYIVQYFGTQRTAPSSSVPTSIIPVTSTPAQILDANTNVDDIEVTPSTPVSTDTALVINGSNEERTDVLGAEVVQEKQETVEVEKTQDLAVQEEKSFVAIEMGNDAMPAVVMEGVPAQQVTQFDIVTSAPRSILVLTLAVLMIALVLKLGVALHLRHPRLVAIIFTLIVLLAVLIYINNSGLFAGTIM